MGLDSVGGESVTADGMGTDVDPSGPVIVALRRSAEGGIMSVTVEGIGSGVEPMWESVDGEEWNDR
jgi:hypothetical protein